MSNSNDNDDSITEEILDRSFEFDKFMEDIEKKANIRKESLENLTSENNIANRLRDARNREHVQNRIRWSR